MNETTEPSAEQIKRFIDIFMGLSAFEAQHQHIRGWGMGSGPRPDPDVVTVLEWLRGRSA